MPRDQSLRLPAFPGRWRRYQELAWLQATWPADRSYAEVETRRGPGLGSAWV